MHSEELTSSHVSVYLTTSRQWQPPSLPSSFVILPGDPALLMTWLKNLTNLSFPRQRHFVHSGVSHQRWLVKVKHLIFLSFLSLGQVLFHTWPISDIVLIRSDRKTKLPICRESCLKKRILSLLSSINPKSLSFRTVSYKNNNSEKVWFKNHWGCDVT